LRDLVGVDFKMLAGSANVLSPRTAASATLALKTALWFLLGRFIVSAPSGLSPLSLSEQLITYRPVQFFGGQLSGQ
jgi:hypothetical protein